MTTSTTQNDNTTLRDAITRILEGEAPNGLDLSAHAHDALRECYVEVVEAWKRDGQLGAQKAATAYLKSNPAAQHAMSGASPVAWTGKASPKTADYVRVLEALGYSFQLNVCNDVVEVNSVPITDTQASKIRTQLRDLGYTHVHEAEDAWIAHAYDRRYHPVRDFLRGLSWDGVDHIGALLSYITADAGDLPTFLKRWLVGACARAFEPGSCQNRMLVLDGDQGLGKSYLVRWLFDAFGRDELFIEGGINPSNKDHELRLISRWIWEVSELGATTTKADRDALKYFLSQRQVTVRKPYGHYDLVKPALASFIGTVNNIAGFLNDPTGSRRFMSVRLTSIDWRYTSLDAKGIWAQAFALYKAGEPWELTPEEAAIADAVNETYKISDPLEDILQRAYKMTGEPGDFVSTVDIREKLNLNGWRLQTPRAEAMAIAEAMKAWGVESDKRTVRTGQPQERGYAGIRER